MMSPACHFLRHSCTSPPTSSSPGEATLNNFGSGSRIMNRKYPSGSHIVDRKYPKFLVSCLWQELLRWTHEKFHSRETTWTLQSKWGRGFWTRILENCMNDSTLGLNKYCSNCTALRGLGYDKKSDKGSKSVPMRHENSGASKVVENWLPTSVSDTSDAQLSDYV